MATARFQSFSFKSERQWYLTQGEIMNLQSGKRASFLVHLLLLVVLMAVTGSLRAEYPYPSPPGGVDPYDYHEYLFIQPGEHPDDWDNGDRWELASEYEIDPNVCEPGQPPECWEQEMEGITGMRADRAWELSTGRPDVVVAVLDCGIFWQRTDLVNKLYLNPGELPLPEGATDYDADNNGSFDIRDYLGDSRVFDVNENGRIDPGDLIEIFSDGGDDDGNGYVDDISGWDFYQGDNQPFDDVSYGHGSGIATDAAAEANNGSGGLGVCPNCKVLPVRIGDSFIVEVNEFAQGVLFAVDSGASVVGNAIGSLNIDRFAREAVKYAYDHGVLVVSSAADEESQHHNMPADDPHCINVNSVRYAESEFYPTEVSYILMNGCTNYGTGIDVAVPTAGCSSGATARTTGFGGLIYSAALNAAALGVITYYPAEGGGYEPWVLSALEAIQIIKMSADDINTSAIWELNNIFWPSERFHATEGWDPYFGFGRINARSALEMIYSGAIPPEANLESPARWSILDPEGGVVEIRGIAAARRSSSFIYVVEVAPSWSPAPDDYIEFEFQSGLTEPVEGRLADLSPSWVAGLMPHGTTGPAADPDTLRGDPNRFAITVRLRVVDAEGREAVAVLPLFIHEDPDLDPEFPIDLEADGAGSPLFFDLDRDGAEELFIATSNGEVHAFDSEGGELPGFPVSTDPIPLVEESPAYQSGEITLPVYSPILMGTVAIGDLESDGQFEIVAADMEGKVYVWEEDGSRRPGFPVSTNRAFSTVRREDGTYCRDRYNRVDWGISGSPTLADLDANGQLEIIVGALDGHVYAWRADGSALPGWPVLLSDPTYVASVEPGTHYIEHTPEGEAGIGALGRKILSSVSVGDLDGDGSLDVVVSINEAYAEERNMALQPLEELLFEELASFLDPGNSRVYAIYADGTLHDGDPSDDDGLDPDAFLPGWPVRTAMLLPGLLPMVGMGTNGSPALADLDGDGDDEVLVHAVGGPVHIFDGDGSGWLGEEAGKAVVLPHMYEDFGLQANTTDSPSYSSFGGPVFGRDGEEIIVAAAGGGVVSLIDVAMTARQENADNQSIAWSVAADGTAAMLPGFPREVNDMAFFLTAAVADLDGDDLAEVIIGSGVYDLHAENRYGEAPPGWPKFTGGWIVGAPAVGDYDGDGLLEVACPVREERLFLWHTTGPATGNRSWPQYQHDRHNWGNLNHDPPSPVPYTPTPLPTDTPLPTETPLPTDTPAPTETPLPSPTPEATSTALPTTTPAITPTATPAVDLGVTLEMPATYFRPGDTCGLQATLGNPGAPLTAVPLFVLLDVAGNYWAWPSWQQLTPPLTENVHYKLVDVPTGSTELEIIPTFTWPDVQGSLEGITFIGAMVDPAFTGLIGDAGTFTFGYGPR
jgi:hypothetical protein